MIEMQLRNANKVTHDRRFTNDEKNFRMIFYKQSPQTYRLMASLLIVPSESTMKRHSQKLNWTLESTQT